MALAGYCILAAGCSPHKPEVKDNINREIIGSWNNDAGCTATFIKHDGTLVLQNFNNSGSSKFANITLISYKESIFSKFKTANGVVPAFSGMFTEGVIIIDTYCTGALHKTDS